MAGSELSPRSSRVVVIGAGLAGLVTVKSCVEEGLAVKAFEMSDGPGGNWRFKEVGVSVFRNTELTSSKYITAFSDFPPPEDCPYFMTGSQYYDYLMAYCHRFDLERWIQFGTLVESVRRMGSHWVVQVVCDGQRQSHECDAVAVCTGLNQERFLPDVENLDQFEGEIVHSSVYKDSGPYRDRKVVIVGGGESGGDILDELSTVAEEATLSLRRGAFVMPKLEPRMTLPGDYFHHRSTYHLPQAVYSPIENCFQALFDFVNRKRRPWQFRRRMISLSGGCYHQQFITKSDVFCDALARPGVSLKPAVSRFGPDRVYFADGTYAEADAVIFCSGFKVRFPFLPIDSEGWDWRQLYKKVLHPRLPGIAFVGFARPHIGAIPPVTELQARYFAGVASGRLPFPERDVMDTAIRHDAEETSRLKPVVCQRITSIVSFIPYMYELADLIGCRPVLREFITRPAVLWSVLFGTVAPPHFRLSGPHADPGAADVIEREGLHVRRLKSLTDKALFAVVQIVWGLACIVGYPLFKAISALPGVRSLKPELDF